MLELKNDVMRIGVAGIVENNGKILVGKKIVMNHLLSGKWHIPGGRLMDGENEEQALVREFQEEAGIEINVEKFLDEGYSPTSRFLIRWYLCSANDEDIKAGSDLAEVRWVPKDEVLKICDKVAIDRWPKRVKDYFRDEK